MDEVRDESCGTQSAPTESKKIVVKQFINAFKDHHRFILLEDGWIKDSFTGLDWGPSSEETMDFGSALKYCEEELGRLPELHELHSLVDFSKKEPATYEIFKDMKHDDWYWSGTKTAWRSDAAWCVSFNSGSVGRNIEDGGNYVRPVRASQSV